MISHQKISFFKSATVIPSRFHLFIFDLICAEIEEKTNFIMIKKQKFISTFFKNPLKYKNIFIEFMSEIISLFIDSFYTSEDS